MGLGFGMAQRRSGLQLVKKQLVIATGRQSTKPSSQNPQNPKCKLCGHLISLIERTLQLLFTLISGDRSELTCVAKNKNKHRSVLHRHSVSVATTEQSEFLFDYSPSCSSFMITTQLTRTAINVSNSFIFSFESNFQQTKPVGYIHVSI